MAANVASPLHLFTTLAATAPALNTRSGASSTQPPCASLCTRRTPRGAIADGVWFTAASYSFGTNAPGGTCFGATYA